MDNAEIIKVLENEMECIRRQDTPKCPRFVRMTCAACDLITDTSKVLEAFQGAIKAVKKQMAKEAEEEAYREALAEAHMLDEKEATAKGRWNI